MSALQARTRPDFLEYCFTVGITTMDGRGFYFPTDTAVGKDDRLYVVNRAQDGVARGIRVTMCDAEGEFYGNFGYFGEGDGQLKAPAGVAADSQGRVYVTDEYLNRISVFDDSGNFLFKWGAPGRDEGEFDSPSAMALDGEDNLYVSDSYNNRVQKFTSDGRFVLSFGDDGTLRLPWGLTVAPAGDVYVADWGNDRIQRFTADGKHVAAYGAPGAGDGQFQRPSGVAVDSDGYMYVADWGNERLQALDPDGGFVTKERGQATLSGWAENFLRINSEEGEARARADLEKGIDYPYDDPHEESSHIEKYFWAPASVKFDSTGRLYVTETNRHRIQVYRRRA